MSNTQGLRQGTHKLCPYGEEGGVVGPRGGVTSGGGRTGVDGEEGVGVAVPVACGVAEVFTAGVGDGERPGIVITWPSESELGSAILLARTMSSTDTPNISAMPESVSPALTVYAIGGTVGIA